MTGAQLRKWRQRIPATQEEVAAELGVGTGTVSRLETGSAIRRLYHVALAHVATMWGAPLPEDPE